MSQSLVQYFQASGNILFVSCAIGPREDGVPACAMSCFFCLAKVRTSISLSHSPRRDFRGSSAVESHPVTRRALSLVPVVQVAVTAWWGRTDTGSLSVELAQADGRQPATERGGAQQSAVTSAFLWHRVS